MYQSSQQKRTIRFALNEQSDIYPIPSREEFSPEDRLNIWYREDDIFYFKQEARIISRFLRATFQAHEYQCPLECDDLVARGLEHKIFKDRLVKRRLITRAILCYYNHHKGDAVGLSRVSEHCTRASRSEARKIGLKDAKDTQFLQTKC